MSAREKGPLTKDSVSLLPCFYFVEVGSRRMFFRDSNQHVCSCITITTEPLDGLPMTTRLDSTRTMCNM